MGKVIMFPKQIPSRTEYKSRQATKEVRHIHNCSGELPCDTEPKPDWQQKLLDE